MLDVFGEENRLDGHVTRGNQHLAAVPAPADRGGAAAAAARKHAN